MTHVSVNLDEKAIRVVGLGKALARGAGDQRLDTVHLFKAALQMFPDEVARHIRETGSASPDAAWDFMPPPGDPQTETDRMPLTRGLAAVVRKLGQGGKVVTLEFLLRAILSDPSVRVKSLLDRAGGTLRVSGRRGSKSGARPHSYASRRDWLADLRTEFVIRKSAARASGLCGCIDQDDYLNSHSAERVLDVVVRVTTATRSKAEASPVKNDPLGPLGPDLDAVQRGVCEGLLVDQLYGLGMHPFGGLSIRSIAQMLSPETYPGNCRKVLAAVDCLEDMGVVFRCEQDELARLNCRVRLADKVLTQVLAGLEDDAISAGEFSEMRRKLRHGTDWGDGGLKQAI